MKTHPTPLWLHSSVVTAVCLGMAAAVYVYPCLFEVAERSHPDQYLRVIASAGANYRTAHVIARNAAERLQYDPDAFTAWGRVLWKQGDLDGAKTACSRALEIRTGPPPGYRDTLQPFYHPEARLSLMELALWEGNRPLALHHYVMADAYHNLASDKFASFHDSIDELLTGYMTKGRGSLFHGQRSGVVFPIDANAIIRAAMVLGVEPGFPFLMRNDTEAEMAALVNLPSDSYFRPFALAKLHMHTGNPAYADELTSWMTRAQPLLANPSPGSFRDDSLTLEGLQKCVVNGDCILVLLRWRHDPSSPEPVYVEHDGMPQVTWNDKTLSLQWVVNRVLPFETGPPGLGISPAGWINPDRDWVSPPKPAAWQFEYSLDGSMALRIRGVPESDTLPRALSAPVRLDPGEAWVCLGTVRCDEGPAEIGWEFLGRDEQVWASGEAVRAATGERASGAAWVTPGRQWLHARMVAGLPDGTGSAAFGGMALFRVAVPVTP
jgi:hypothetical protein